MHSAEVVCADRPRMPDRPYLKADAILTDRPGVSLFMRFADCVPIFLYDPIRRVVGLVHAGWAGTVNKIARETIHTMKTRYGCQPKHIIAAIGPSTGPDHYTIGPDVEIQVQAAFGEGSKSLLQKNDHAVQFDLWTANRMILEEAGICQIEIARICTACHLDDWYSHRGERGKTGRFGALIGLNQ